MRIDERTIGNVTVLELHGRMTSDRYGELYRCVSDLIREGRVKVVMDLRGVSFVDSSGLGEIVQVFTSLQQAGGALLISRPSNAQLEHYAISKLSHVFVVFPTIEDAVREFDEVQHVYVACPACRLAPDIKVQMRSIYTDITCPACAAIFRIKAIADVEPGSRDAASDQFSAPVAALRLPTYDNEYVDVNPGNPSWMTLRRLDAFTLDMVDKACALLADPLRIVFDIGHVGDSTATGIARLIAWGEQPQHGEAFAVFAHKATERDQRGLRERLSPHFTIYQEGIFAVRAALQSGDAGASSITVVFTRGG